MDTAQIVPDKKTAPPEGRFRAYLHFGSPFIGYALSIALAALALWLELPFLRQTQFAAPFGFLYPAFTLFYPAIALTSFLAGAGPGIVSIVLAGIFGVNFFPHMPGPLSWIALTLLGPMLAMICKRQTKYRLLKRLRCDS